ncbi:hypothetical protein COOONC_14236 [Cooperia oncophora]
MLNTGTLLSPESSEEPPPLEDFAEEDQSANEDVDLDFLDEFAYLLVGYTVKKMQSMERGVLEIELNPERNGLVKALREKTDEFIKSDKEIHNVLWHVSTEGTTGFGRGHCRVKHEQGEHLPH